MGERVSGRDVRARLVRDIALWQADGLVSAETAARLRERYELRRFGLGQVMRYLGTIGMVFVGLGILGLMGVATQSELATGVLLVLVGGGAIAAGVRLARDPLGRYPWSSKTVLTFGALMATGGIWLLLDASGIHDGTLLFAWGLLVIPALGVLAYTCRITFLLVLALVAFFHWVGSWQTMVGRSTYVMDIQDPATMSLVALGAIGAGLWHEHALRERTGRFFVAYESLGLVYLNLSLLFLSIEAPAPWAFALLAATVAQVIAGARLHNPLLLGFGVTFVFINGFTRYFETFWDPAHKAAFFLFGGALTFTLGVLCEAVIRTPRQETR